MSGALCSFAKVVIRSRWFELEMKKRTTAGHFGCPFKDAAWERRVNIIFFSGLEFGFSRVAGTADAKQLGLGKETQSVIIKLGYEWRWPSAEYGVCVRMWFS